MGCDLKSINIYRNRSQQVHRNSFLGLIPKYCKLHRTKGKNDTFNLAGLFLSANFALPITSLYFLQSYFLYPLFTTLIVPSSFRLYIAVVPTIPLSNEWSYLPISRPLQNPTHSLNKFFLTKKAI